MRVVNSVIDFKWDSDKCAQNIVLSEDNHVCILSEGGYCFRTVVGTVGFMGGVHYWEIHADSQTENELKIGVAMKNTFNLNTVLKRTTKIGILRLRTRLGILWAGSTSPRKQFCGTQIRQSLQKLWLSWDLLRYGQGTAKFCAQWRAFRSSVQG